QVGIDKPECCRLPFLLRQQIELHAGPSDLEGNRTKLRLSGKRCEQCEPVTVGEFEAELYFGNGERGTNSGAGRDDEFGACLRFEIEALGVGIVELEVKVKLQSLFGKEPLQQAVAIAALEDEFALFHGERDLELLTKLLRQKHPTTQFHFTELESRSFRGAEEKRASAVGASALCEAQAKVELLVVGAGHCLDDFMIEVEGRKGLRDFEGKVPVTDLIFEVGQRGDRRD